MASAWLPNPGPQTLALHSPADQLFYGGAAGGGKTDLLIGLSATQHRNSIIWRREKEQLKALVRRVKEVLVPRYAPRIPRSNVVDMYDGRVLELAGMEYFDDRENFQGQPHDLKAFDEITHFMELQYRYVIAWLRTTDRRQKRTRVVATGNPPTSADGRWVIAYWKPWLDDKYPYPAKPGELRWFITNEEGKDTVVEGPGKYTVRGRELEAHSRTFIPSSTRDNPWINSAYYATLSSLPEPLRSQLMDGKFTAGIEDDEYQLFPTEWLRAAQARWVARGGKPQDNAPMDQLGVDVARGGRDKTVLSPRYGNLFAAQKAVPGVTTKDGPAVATLVLGMVHPTNEAKKKNKGTRIAIDGTGVGVSPLDVLNGNGLPVLNLVMAGASNGKDKSGLLGFVNVRAEIAWKFREALDPTSGEELAIPDDPEIFEDLVAMRWMLKLRGVQVEEKEKIKARLGRSPDKGEALLYASANLTMPGQGIFEWMQSTYDSEQERRRKEQEEEKRKRGK